MNNEVRKEIGGLDLFNGKLDNFRGRRSLGLSLGRDVLSGFLGLGLLNIILSNSLEEGESGIRVSDVLNSNVDFLGNLSLLDLLLDDDTDRSRVDIEYLTSSSVVKVVGHTLVLRTINDNVDVISESVLFEVVAHSDSSVSSEAFRKLMSGS